MAFIGAVGDDAFGAGARDFQRAEGIDWRAVVKTGHPTGTAAILVNDQGQNEIIVALDANNALTPADIDAHADVLRAATVMVTQLEANLGAQAHAMRLARSAGATVILNPAPMRPDFDPALLAEVDILVPNETEFGALTGLDEQKLAAFADADLHAACRRVGVETVIVTLGERGCFVSRANGFAAIPAMTGINAVDTTGAGDAFVGAFAAALAEFGGGEIEQAARFANAGAALIRHPAGDRARNAAPGGGRCVISVSIRVNTGEHRKRLLARQQPEFHLVHQVGKGDVVLRVGERVAAARAGLAERHLGRPVSERVLRPSAPTGSCMNPAENAVSRHRMRSGPVVCVSVIQRIACGGKNVRPSSVPPLASIA